MNSRESERQAEKECLANCCESCCVSATMSQSDANTYYRNNAQGSLYRGDTGDYLRYTLMAATTKPADAPPSNQSMSSAEYKTQGPK